MDKITEKKQIKQKLWFYGFIYRNIFALFALDVFLLTTGIRTERATEKTWMNRRYYC